MRSHRMRRSALPALAMVLLAGGAILTVLGGCDVPESRLMLAASGPELSLSELSEQSVIIALVIPKPGSQSHWNSSDNRPWEAANDSGLQPMIVTDQHVKVLRAWRGATAGDGVVVRTVGGTVGSAQFIYENGGSLTGSEAYLVFLRRDDWLGKDIVDTNVLSPIGLEQGVFIEAGGSFSNAAGLTVTLDELSAP